MPDTNQAPVTPNVMDKYAGMGTETLGNSTSTPVIRILQSTSAEIDRSKKDYALKKIEGAQAGDIYHSQLGIIKRPMRIVPVKFADYYEENAGTGNNSKVVGTHPADIVRDSRYSRSSDKRSEEFISYEAKDNNGRPFKIVNRLYYTIVMGVVLPDYSNTPAIFRFQSTMLKVVRALQTSLRNFRYPSSPLQPPVFARSWLVDTIADNNDKGGWMVYSFSPERALDAAKPEDVVLLDAAAALINQPLLQNSGIMQTLLTDSSESAS